MEFTKEVEEGSDNNNNDARKRAEKRKVLPSSSSSAASSSSTTTANKRVKKEERSPDFTVHYEYYGMTSSSSSSDEEDDDTSYAYWDLFIKKVTKAGIALQEKGFAVIPRLISKKDCSLYERRMMALMLNHLGIEDILNTDPKAKKTMTEVMTQTFVRGKRNANQLPPHKHGILESHRANRFDVVDEIRAHPKIALVFALLYGLTSIDQLVSSIDRVNFMLPGRSYAERTVNPNTTNTTVGSGGSGGEELEEEKRADSLLPLPKEAYQGWAHIDQCPGKYGNGPWCIQAYLDVKGSKTKESPSNQFYEGSHSLFKTFCTEWFSNETSDIKDDWIKLTPEQKAKFLSSDYALIDGDDDDDDDDDDTTTRMRRRRRRKMPVRRVKPIYPEGSLVLWQGATVHDPYPGSKDYKDGRFVVYTCMLPRMPELVGGNNDSVLKSKREAYLNARATRHTPLPQRLFSETPRNYGKKGEDIAYHVVPVKHTSPEKYHQQRRQEEEEPTTMDPPPTNTLASYLFCFQKPKVVPHHRGGSSVFTAATKKKGTSAALYDDDDDDDDEGGIVLYPPSPFLKHSRTFLDTLEANPSMLAYPPPSSSSGGVDVDGDHTMTMTTTTTTTIASPSTLVYRYEDGPLVGSFIGGAERKAFANRNRSKK